MAESILKLENITKTFGKKQVLDNLSFEMNSGEILGLLGPNGAGKTTTIRIILNIIKPDKGKVILFDKELNDKIFDKENDKIGYLPEERGLYLKETVYNNISYFADLKNLKDIDQKINHWLKKVNFLEYKNKKVETLSKGMQQIIQFIVAIIHNPDLIIIDEPFYGLDPVNSRLFKDIILDLKKQGKSIILSTHQMTEVERMCDRILMLNKGKRVLYGKLSEIKDKYKESIFVEYSRELKLVEGIEKINDFGNSAEIILSKNSDIQDVLKGLVNKNILRSFEIKSKSLEEIFIEEAKK